MHPVLALIIANIIWGMAPPIFKFALVDIPPFTLAFLRFYIGALLFLPFIHFSSFEKITKQDFVKIFLGALFGITINIALFFLALQKTDSIPASIIASSGPLFLYILAILFLHEKLKVRVASGMFISFCGVLLLVLAPIFADGGIQKVTLHIEGNILYVISTISSILMPLLLKGVLKRNNVTVVTFLTFLIGALTFLPFMIGEFQKWNFSYLNMPGIIGIVFGAVFSSALAYYLYNYGIEKIATSEVGLFTYIDPFVTVFIAIPLLQEYPDIFFFLAALLVFGGIFIAEKRIHYHPFHKLKTKNS